MADWYASSTAYAAVPQWAASTAYTVGQFVRALAAPTQPFFYYVYRCTTAGTSGTTEPVWNSSNNGTTASGTATFTNVTGQSAYGWSAAGGTVYSLGNAGVPRLAAGDRLFVSNDHSETHTSNIWTMVGGHAWGSVSIISVNRAGSVPPVAADVLPGATINGTNTTSFTFEAFLPTFWQGVVFNISAPNLYFNSGSFKGLYLKDCAIVLNNAGQTKVVSNNPTETIWDNTTLRVANATSLIQIQAYAFSFTWLNTPAAIQGTPVPAALLQVAGGAGGTFTLRGVDLSAIIGTLLAAPASTNAWAKVLLDECRIAPGVTRMYTPSTTSPLGDLVELVNCFDGTNIINERYRSAGALTTERGTVLSGGAIDATGAFSFKLVSSSRADRFVEALDTFYFDVENTAVGSPKTATVEIISSGTLNENDVFLTLEYLGTAGSSLAKYGSSLPSSVSSAALPTSSVTWNSPPATPVKQYLRTTFTPQTAGRVRGRVHLGKPSTTVWVNPQIAIS